jgi:hypothetical protein
MINIIQDIYDINKHTKLMNDSVLYITNRLETFYNTAEERADIQRNLEYLKTMLNKDFISNNLSENTISNILNIIDKAQTTLYNNKI